MKVKVAKTAGFCMGVRRAVELTMASSRLKKLDICTYGQLIHNSQVVNSFIQKNVKIVNKISGEGKIFIVRAHGVPPKIKIRLLILGNKLIDATCPNVIKIQRIIEFESEKRCVVIIAGNKKHPEVVGLAGYAKYEVYVVLNKKEINELFILKKSICVSQTTQSVLFYKKIKSWITNNNFKYKIFKTICNSTVKRHIEVKKIVKRIDMLLIIGGEKSGNTKRLKELALKSGILVLHIENKLEIYAQTVLNLMPRVGIIAGASTPKWMIKRIYNLIKKGILYL